MKLGFIGTGNMAGAIMGGIIRNEIFKPEEIIGKLREAEIVLAQGTTAVFWDPHELANVLGVAGVRYAVEASRHLPLQVMVAAPSSVPSTPGLEMSGADFAGAEMETMLGWPEVRGVAEVMDMHGVLHGSCRMQEIVQAGLNSGKLIEGHARGLSGADLQAYLAAGVTSDHELTSADDALEKLRAGLTIEIRGSHPYLLPDIVAALKTLPHLSSQITVCTDDVPPDMLLEKGGIIALLTPGKDGELTIDFDDIVQRAVTVVRDGEVTWPPPAAQVSAAPPAAPAKAAPVMNQPDRPRRPTAATETTAPAAAARARRAALPWAAARTACETERRLPMP